MTTTPKLAITHLTEGQASAEVTVNDALNLIDQFCQSGPIRIKDRDLTSPPGSPSEGDAYLVGGSATGDWSGQDGDFAIYLSGWIFRTPAEGSVMWVDDEDKYLVYTGSVWSEIGVEATAIAYGELYTDDNSAGTAQTVGTDFAQVTQWDAVGNESNMTGSVSTDDITAGVGGTYLVFLAISFSGTALATFTVGVSKNDTVQNNLRLTRKLGTGGDVGAASISGLLSLSTNDTVELYVKADAASKDFLVHEANLSLHKVG